MPTNGINPSEFYTTKKVSFQCSSSSSDEGASTIEKVTQEDQHPYRAVPLSTKNVLFMTIGMTIYSLVYLFPAQNDKLLFYLMTGLIVIFVMFIYAFGFLAVIFMVTDPYSKVIPIEVFECSNNNDSSQQFDHFSEESEEVSV
ncbi:unnamed protein product, partial [Mesorhabditis belari]|uniref:Uncharacterized protein n=1 Tax=Mesorhabditis belari TaxID=2138241 RepID=A0AAF3EQT9_9BILA